MTGYVKQIIVDERENVRLVECTLTDGSKVYDLVVDIREDGVRAVIHVESQFTGEVMMKYLGRSGIPLVQRSPPSFFTDFSHRRIERRNEFSRWLS